jgi:hypothetical protein
MLLATWGFAPLVALIIDVAVHGGVLSGSDGGAPSADQFQYMAWIREAGMHGLIANSFELTPTHAVFLQPMFLLSGIAWRLGLGIQLAYLVWKPVAMLALLFGFARYASRAERGSARVGVLLLALFCLSPALPALDWAGQLHGATRFDWLLAVEELSPVWQLWGYPSTAIAIGLMPLALLAAERALTETGPARTRPLILATVAAALVAWLHPWQGATLALIWVGLFIWGRGAPAYRRLALPFAGTIAPLVYYEVLVHADSAWKLAQRQNVYPHLGGLALLAAIAPLALLAVPALLTPTRDLFERMTRLWVLLALVVYFATRTFPEHALQGLSLPLAVLAVAGWRRLAWGRGLAIAGIAAAIIPGAIWSGIYYRDSVRSHIAPYILTAQEHAALSFLERARGPGGVFASEYLGMAVPAFTGRNSWRGHDVWTPAFATRDLLANALLSGGMPAATARALVAHSGARYLLADCSQQLDLRPLLGAIVTAVHRFGCVTVYDVE